MSGVIYLQRFTLTASVASTSGTVIDFTNIPNWVKRITLNFQSVSTNGTSPIGIRLGTASAFATSGYEAVTTFVSAAANTSGGASWTSAFGVSISPTGANAFSGTATFELLASNIWTFKISANTGTGSSLQGGGFISLVDTLTRLRLTTTGGTDVFDAGSISVSYEG